MANLFLGTSGIYGSTTAVDLLLEFESLNFDSPNVQSQRQPDRFYLTNGATSLEYTALRESCGSGLRGWR